MKKRWIPFIVTCIAVALIIGLRFGAESESYRQVDMHTAQSRLNTTVAVVNGDAGVLVNGGWYNYSAAIIDTLGDDFVLVSPAMAQTGFASGTYAAIVTFPSNVSTKVLSFNAAWPERVQLEFQINPNLSEREYLETFIAITELQMAINTTLASTYVSSILRQFHDAQDHVDGVFQNNLADLLAVELITLGDFTADLDLDDVPFVPIQPRQLDTPFYMDIVRGFAEEVANWYLHSYAMASNQFLWMRTGLISLTENFPAQEDAWLSMLMAWTGYSEFYGELLDIFFEDVSAHETDLRAWHQENVVWNQALEAYQNQILDWQDISISWLWDAEFWHMDYQSFLGSVEDYSELLMAYHASLEASLLPVLGDLTDWKELLQDYERRMFGQFGYILDRTDDLNSQIQDTTTFLQHLLEWHTDLISHTDILEYWRIDLTHGKSQLNTWHYDLEQVHTMLEDARNIFEHGFDALPYVPAPLPYAQFNALTLPNLTLGITTGPAMYITFANIPNVTICVDSVVAGMIGGISVDLSNLTFTNPNPLPCTGHLSFSYIKPMSASGAALSTSFEAPLSSCLCVNCQINSAIDSFIPNLLMQVESQVQTEVNTQVATQLNSLTPTLQGSIDYQIDNINYNYVSQLNYDAALLEDWHMDLKDDIIDMTAWLHDTGLFYNDLADFFGTLTTSTYDISDFIYSLTDLAEDIDDIVLPTLPDTSDIQPLEKPNIVNLSIPNNVSPLDVMPIPTWDTSIYSPAQYDGRSIYQVFDVDFPTVSINNVMGLDLPPAYFDYQIPFPVHEHFMFMAERPQSPLIPPPPRPDDFWDSLNFMHDQLLNFNVDDFLSYDIHLQVERSLQNYEVFLNQIRQDLNFLFEDNIWLMHDVNAEYNRFLSNLRHDAFAAAASEQEALQSTIDSFVTIREESNENTIERLGAFASMMPESRAIAGINQGLVDFAVMPFDFVPITIRDEVTFEHPESMVATYMRFQQIAVWVLGGVLTLTLFSILVAHLFQKRKVVAGPNRRPLPQQLV